MVRKKAPSRVRQVVLNAGSGPTENNRYPAFFSKWKHIRVDVDPEVDPDLVASVTDLQAIPNGKVDAIWSSHCMEHLYAHEVVSALGEFRRVVRETGFICIVVPDLQAVADWIAKDRLDEVIYESASGPVTAHDMIWGFGPALARGKVPMAHRSGFTPTRLLNCLTTAGFEEILLRRRETLELVAIALPRGPQPGRHKEELMAELGF